VIPYIYFASITTAPGGIRAIRKLKDGVLCLQPPQQECACVMPLARLAC
jgi:hypothetical protein